MKIIDTISGLESVKSHSVLTIGNFDGVHIGHSEIITTAKQAASQSGAELVAMTFEPHPVAILHPEKSPGVLTPLEMKENLLAALGVDLLIVLRDSRELLELSPEDFVDKFLMDKIRPAVVVEGENFNFGRQRLGSVYTLYNLGKEKGFEVVVVESKNAKFSIGQSVLVSSTLIRNMLESGNVADAAIGLGRPYRLLGKVVAGKGKGKQLGFPTANIESVQQIVPAEGVYAGRVQIGETKNDVCEIKIKDTLPAALSIGRAETLGIDAESIVEAHILVESVDDLRNKYLAIDFVGRIRSQQKFGSEKELSLQIVKDCEKAKKILDK
ncbi:MAG: bifunctional riboflavin kinase/FAD synthetase [Planctomycetes bacterium]|nr:bifunctional riboflavin kinase/FAD synthetase [Planctomycetota bacterium]